MTFLDTLGRVATSIGDFTGLTDAVHDLSIAATDLNLGNDNNTGHDVYGAIGAVASAGATPFFKTTNNLTDGLITKGAKAAAYTSAGVGFGWAELHDQGSSQDWRTNWDTNFEGAFGAIQRDDNSSMASVTAGQSLFNTLFKGNASAAEMTQNERDKAYGSGAAEYFTGTTDTVVSAIADPSNLLPGAGKAAKLAMFGGELTQAASVSRLAGAMGKVPISSFTEDVTKGGTEFGSKTADMFETFAQGDQTTAMKHQWVQAQPLANQAAIARLLGTTKTTQQVADVMHVLAHTPERDAAYARLLEQSGELSALDAAERAAMLEGITNGQLSTSTMDNLFLAHLSDPNGSLTRAWQQTLDNAFNEQLVTRGFAKSPVQTLQNRAAESLPTKRFGSPFADVAPGEPRVFVEQPTRYHPIMTIIDFATKGRGSGWINANDGDSFHEIEALVGDVNRETDNALTNSGEARYWMNQYLSANTNTDRMKIAKLIEQRGVDLLTQKHGLNKDLAADIWSRADARRGAALQQYKDQNFVSWALGDNSVYAKIPFLERENVDALPLIDMKQFNVSLSRYNSRALNAAGALKDGTVGAADVVNDLWKTSVLIRGGYTLRNLAEAGLSIAASGHAPKVFLAALTQHNLTDFAAQKYRRSIDRFNVATGRELDLPTANRDEALRSVEYQVAQANHDAVINATLRNANMRLSNTDRDILERYQTEQTSPSLPLVRRPDHVPLTQEEYARAKELHANLMGVATLRNETSLATTYHRGTSDFRRIEGDYVDTTPSRGVATLRQDDAYESVNFATVNRRPIGFADQNPTTTPVAWAGGPRLFHGTSNEFVDGLKGPDQLFNGSSLLRGEGFYTTDDLNIAQSYTNKGKRANSTPTVYSVKWTGKGKPKILNADTASSPAATQWGENMARMIQEHDGETTALASVLERGGTVSEVMDAARADLKTIQSDGLSGLTRNDVDEMYQILAEDLRHEGYDILAHKGGVATNAKVKHNVHVFLGTENVSVTKHSDALIPSNIPVALRNGYQHVLDTALDHVRNGRVVEQRSGQQWRVVSEQQLQYLRDKQVLREDARRQFRVRDAGPAPKVFAIPSYGRELDLTKFSTVPDDLKPILNIHSVKPRETARKRANKPSHQEWVQNQSWNDPEVAAKLTQYAKDNGYGRIILPDSEWGHTVRVLKDYAQGYGGQGAKSFIQHTMGNVYREAINDGYTGVVRATGRGISKMDRRENRAARQAARRDGTTVNSWDVNSRYTQTQLDSMVHGGTLDAYRKSVADMAQAKANLEEASNLRRMVEERHKNLGYDSPGTFGKRPITYHTHDGHAVDISAFAGSQGQLFWRRTHGDQSWADQTVDNSSGIHQNLSGYDAVPVRPNDPEYYKAWANILNFHWRDPAKTGIESVDPLARHILANRTPDEMEAWLRGDGRAYADEMGWSDENIPHVVAGMNEIFPRYVPEHIRHAWVDGLVDANMLREHFPNTNELPDLVGLKVPQSREARDVYSYRNWLRKVEGRIMHAIGSAPETAMARHPLYVSIANDLTETRIREAEMRNGGPLSLDQVNAIAKRAKEQARIDVSRTLFTISRRTGASQTARLIAPFYAAWENTLQRWSRFAVTNTGDVAHLLVQRQKFLNNAVLINNKTGDKGDPSKDPMSDLSMIFPYDIGGEKARIPLASADVIFQGNAMNPGIGPYVALPLSRIVADKPEYGNIMKWAFPAGYPRDAASVFLPAAVNKWRSMHNEDQAYTNDVVRLYEHEYVQFETGKRSTPPSLSEIKDKANQLYSLKFLTNMLSPASVQYTDDITYYTEMYRRYQKMYGNTADQRFLNDHPEYFMVMQPLSKNTYGATATQASVDNAKRYSDLAALASATGENKLVGWVTNYGQGKYDPANFSATAYNWQLDHAPAPGAAVYRSTQNAADAIRQAEIQRGWIRFNQGMDSLTAQATQAGYDINDPTVHKNLMKVVVNWMNKDTSNQSWYEEFAGADKARFAKRADFFQQAINDPTFSADHKDDPTVKAIGVFLTLRSQMENALTDAAANGGSKRMSAKSNYQLAADYLAQVNDLKNQNIGFASWYDTYFTNDPVVL